MNLVLTLLVLICLSSLQVRGEGIPAELIKALGSEDFKERNQSQASLLLWVKENGKSGIDHLVKITSETDDPEIRSRCIKILKELSDEDYLTEGKGYVGIQMSDELIPDPNGGDVSTVIRITRVVRGTPAELAGLKARDVIVSLNGNSWKNESAMQSFMDVIAKTKPKEEVVLKIKREGQEDMDVKVILGRRPVDNLTFDMGEDIETL